MSTSPGPSGEQPPAAGARRQARERAFGLLYEAELKGSPIAEVLAALPIPPARYACELVEGVEARTTEIDELIGSHTNAWALGRLPAVDRQILRIAVFELLASSEVPVAVVLDEAVELAKTYSTETSGRFVNGVLAAVAREVRSGEPVAP